MLQHFSSNSRLIRQPHYDYAPSERARGIADTLDAIRRNKLLIGLCFAASLALGILYVSIAPSVYIATAQVFVQPEQRFSPRTDVIGPTQLDSSQLESQIQVVKSERIARYVVRALSLSTHPEFGGSRVDTGEPPEAIESGAIRTLDAKLGARRIGQSYVIEISFSSRNPETAVRVTNAVTIAYIREQLVQRLELSNRGNEILAGRIAGLRADIEGLDRSVKEGRIALETVPAADARVISSAWLPLERRWPPRGLILGFSGLMGLLIGGAAAAIRTSSGDRIRSVAQVEDEHRIAVIGTLPRVACYSQEPPLQYIKSNPDSAFAADLQRIKTELDVTMQDTDIRCIGFTSALPKEGKSVLAANLAQAYSSTGQRTLLIDCDARSRTLSIAFSGKTETVAATRVVGAPEQNDAPIVISPGLSMMSLADDTSNNAANGLAGYAHMQELLSAARSQYDIILIDLPAMSSAHGARAISPSLDAIVLVANQDVTTNSALGEVLRKLNRPAAKVVGIVLTLW